MRLTVVLWLAPLLLLAAPLAAATRDLRFDAHQTRALIRDSDGAELVRGGFAVEVDGVWRPASSYPRRTRIVQPDGLALMAAGRPDAPDLELSLRHDPLGAVLTIRAMNRGNHAFRIGGFRLVDGRTDRVGRDARVLSDSYSEDTPVLRIRDLRDGGGEHVGFGHQLIYDSAKHRAVLAAALTSNRWLTYLRLAPSGRWTIEQAGTTAAVLHKSLRGAPGQDVIAYEAELAPGKALAGEPLLIAAGADALALLDSYGARIRQSLHARVDGAAPAGWWSWTATYHGLNAGIVRANAQWLAQHLKAFGFDYVHLDDGMAYAVGEYETPDASKFPEGMAPIGRDVAGLGLNLGLWTSPFQVSERAWVFRNHPDWLVRNRAGAPIAIGHKEGVDRLYALDTTHPGAQAYLRQVYRRIARAWGVRYLKLDFMEAAAIEGVRHMPGVSALQAQRIGLQVIRDAVGGDVLLDKDGSPMLNPVGLVDIGRISNDTEHDWRGTRDAASGIAARWFMNRNFFVSDPDVFCLSSAFSHEPRWDERATTADEARAAVTLAALAGGLFEIGDDLPALGREPDRLAMATQPDLLAMVRLGRAARPVDLMDFDPADQQPSIFVLRETPGRAMAAVFNWTDASRTRAPALARLGLEPGPWTATEVWSGTPSSVADGRLAPFTQPPHSVRLFRLERADRRDTPARAAVIGPNSVTVGRDSTWTAEIDPDRPAIAWHWAFDDGIEAEGHTMRRTFTVAGAHTLTLTATGLDGRTVTAAVAVRAQGELDTLYHAERAHRFVDPLP